MYVHIYKNKEANTGILSKTDELINVRRNRWIDKHGTSHPMKFEKPIAFENRNVYYLLLFGGEGTHQSGVHISLSLWENQRFLWLQNKHWFQQKDNVMWIVNILVAILAILATFKT